MVTCGKSAQLTWRRFAFLAIALMIYTMPNCVRYSVRPELKSQHITILPETSYMLTYSYEHFHYPSAALTWGDNLKKKCASEFEPILTFKNAKHQIRTIISIRDYSWHGSLAQEYFTGLTLGLLPSWANVIIYEIKVEIPEKKITKQYSVYYHLFAWLFVIPWAGIDAQHASEREQFRLIAKDIQRIGQGD